jgi:drug/metabolite transporter (DMT)-like permease
VLASSSTTTTLCCVWHNLVVTMEDPPVRVELANLLLLSHAAGDESDADGGGGEVVVLETRFETCTDMLESSAPTQIQAVVDLAKLSELVGVSQDVFMTDLQQQVSDQLQLNNNHDESDDLLFVDAEQNEASERDSLISTRAISDRVSLSADAFVDTLADVMSETHTTTSTTAAMANTNDEMNAAATEPASPLWTTDRGHQLANHAFLLEMPNNDGSSEQPHFILALPETCQDDLSDASNESFLHGLSFLPSDVEDVQLEATTVTETYYHHPPNKYTQPSLRLDMVVKRKVPLIGYILLMTGLFALSSVGVALHWQGYAASPLMKTYWRLTATAIVLTPLVAKSVRSRSEAWPHKLTARQWALLLLCALCYAFMTSAFVMALDMTSLVNAFILSDIAPLFIIVGRWVLGLPILYAEGLGAAIGFLGGTICALDQSKANGLGSELVPVAYHSKMITGDFLAVLASAALAGYLVIAKMLRAEVDLFVFMFLIMLMASFFVLAYMIASGEQIMFSNHTVYGLWGWTNLALDRLPLELYLAVVCNVLGTTGYIAIMKYFEPVVVSSVMLMQPVIGTLMGVAAGLEPWPGPQTWIGDGVVTVGIILVIWSGARTTETIDATEALMHLTGSDNHDDYSTGGGGGVPLLKNPVLASTRSPHRSKPTPLARQVILE